MAIGKEGNVKWVDVSVTLTISQVADNTVRKWQGSLVLQVRMWLSNGDT